MKKIILVLLVLFVSVGYLQASGTAGMQFLKIGADARGNSLSGAVLSTVSGVDSLYWNPAGLNSIKGREAMLTYNHWLANMQYIYVGFGMPLLISKLGRVAGSVTYVSEGSVDNVGAVQDNLKNGSYDLALSGGYAMKLGKIHLGGAIRFITKSIFGYQSTGATVDIGGQMGIPGVNGLTVGMVAKNLGIAFGDISDLMPMTYQIGANYKYVMKDNSINAMVSSDIMVDDSPYVNVGAEYGYRDALYVRVGYRVETAGNVLGGTKGLSVGLGGKIENLLVNDMKADVTWLPMADLGNIMQVSLTVGF